MRVVLALVIAFACSAAAYAQNFGPWLPAVSVDANRVNGVNTPFNDGCPIEAPDAHRLFFASDRSGNNLDIWVAYRATETDPWVLQERLPAPVNTSAREFCPTPLPANQLLFVSTRANNCGGAAANPDIYYTRFHPVQGWLAPQPLSCDVNSGYEEFSPSFVEAEGVTLLYFSSNRAEPQITPTRHKIYVSVLQNGEWGPAAPVEELNFPGASDARPNVRKDGLEIVFDSTRAGGTKIYTATRASVFDSWSPPVALDSTVNIGTSQSRPSISWDGQRLYFGSNAANHQGDTGADIYVSTRSGPGESDK